MNLARALRESGHDVEVAVWNFQEAEVYVDAIRASGARVVGVGGRSFLGKVSWLRRLIREERFDWAHSFSFYLNIAVAIAAAGTTTIAIGSVRSTLALAAAESGRLLGWASARWPRRQVYNNAFAASEAKKRTWWRPRRIAIVPNHVEVDEFPEVDVPPNRTIVGIGSLLAVKRWERLIALGSRLRDCGIDFRIEIAGEGPLRTSLESEIARFALQDRVTLLGYVADVSSILARCAFLVHVSESEGAPNVVMEALAAGRPVVATDVGDVARLVSDGETGFLVPSGDDGMLLDRTMVLLTDYERCATMGRRARAVSRERFGQVSLVGKILDAYRAMERGA